MDVTTFYALFSATCFTLLGLWWSVVQRHEEWLRDPEQRAVVGGVYLSFLLPALMGLFAQVGGTETPAIWRVSFVGIAIIGGVSTLRLLRRSRARPGIHGPADAPPLGRRRGLRARGGHRRRPRDRRHRCRSSRSRPRRSC